MKKEIRAGAVLLLTLSLLTGCRVDLLLPTPSTGVAKDNGVWKLERSGDAARVHNLLMAEYGRRYRTPSAFLHDLPVVLDEILQRFPRRPADLTPATILDWLDAHPITPNDLLTLRAGKPHRLLRESLDASLKRGTIGRTTHDAVTRFLDGLAGKHIDLALLEKAAAVADHSGTALERQWLGTMVGSARFWQETMVRSAGDEKRILGSFIGFVVGFLVDTVYGGEGGIIGVVVAFVMSFFSWLAQIAVDMGDQEGDYPHWGTHHKAAGGA